MITLAQKLTYPYELPELPYAYDELTAAIDETTMQIHHTKHHAAYVTKLNAALEKYPELQSKNLYELLTNLDDIPTEIRATVNNHGGGHANHSFFWLNMHPNHAAINEPVGEVKLAIDINYGTFASFKEQFTNAAVNLFGSGWVWLTLDQLGSNLHIDSTPNQNSPLLEKHRPILALDVWEHAYYLKYQNRRIEYVNAWWQVIDWKAVNQSFIAGRVQ